MLETQCGGRRSLSSAPRGFCSVLDSFDDYNDVLLRLIHFSRNANDHRLKSGKKKLRSRWTWRDLRDRAKEPFRLRAVLAESPCPHSLFALQPRPYDPET